MTDAAAAAVLRRVIDSYFTDDTDAIAAIGRAIEVLERETEREAFEKRAEGKW